MKRRRPLGPPLDRLYAGLLALVLGVTEPSHAQTPDSFDPNPDGLVSALAAQADGKILVGGGFTRLCGQARDRFGRLNADGSLDTTFNPGANEGVGCLAVQADGKIVVGGGFTALGGQPRSRLGRLNADGSLDTTFNPGANSVIYAMAMQADGKILVGGLFWTLGGQPRDYLGRVNVDGTVDSSFNPGANNWVRSLAVQPDGKILVGGYFTVLGGQTHNRLGRLNADGSVDASFTPGADDYVNCFGLQADGKILVAGHFTTLGGQTRGYIGRLNANGSLDTTFNPAGLSSSSSLAVQADGKILLGAEVNYQISRLYRLNTDGTLDATFNLDANNEITSLAVQADGNILVAGSFTTLGGQSRTNLGRLNNTASATQSLTYDTATITWLRGGAGPEVWRTTFDYSTNGVDWTSLGAGTRIADGWRLSGLSFAPRVSVRACGFVTGGHFNGSAWFVEAGVGPLFITSQPVSGTNNAGSTAIITVGALGSEPLSFQWHKNDVDLADGGNVSGVTTPRLTLSNVLRPDTGGYSVVVSNAFGSVTSAVAMLTVLDPVITSQPVGQARNAGESVTFDVVAEGTSPLTYQWRKDEVALDGATGASLTLTNLQGTDAGGYDVVVTNGYGSVTSTAALLTVNTSLPDSFNPGANGEVYSLAAQVDGKILVGGRFTILGGQSRTNLGRLNSDGTLDATFSPGAGGYAVYSLVAQPRGKILVGGDFTTLGGQSRTNLGRLHPDGSVDPDFNPGANGFVSSLVVQADGKILVSGSFTMLGAQSRFFIGRLNADGMVDPIFNPGASPFVYSLAVQADGKILVGGRFFILGGQPRNCLGRLHPDGTLDATFNPGADADDHPSVFSFALQSDRKILVGGNFTTLGGESRTNLGRLNPDGTVDPGFNPHPSGAVYPMAVQTDGRILVGGLFTNLAGQMRNRIGRLNSDGTPDPTFDPGTDGSVYSLAVQADGKILAGGSFSALGGQNRTNLGRVNNTGPATQSLTFDGSTIIWLRGGTGPEVWRTTFDCSTNGLEWIGLGDGTRTAGGSQLNDLSLPARTIVRARGFVAGGIYNGSGWFVETRAATRPKLSGRDFGTNGFRFTFLGIPGVLYNVEYCNSLGTGSWTQMEQRTGAGGLETVMDPSAVGVMRFYRVGASVPP